MARIKGKNMCVTFGASAIPFEVEGSFDVTTNFDETRTKSDTGPARAFDYSSFGATVSAQMGDTNSDMVAELEAAALAGTSKTISCRINGATYLAGLAKITNLKISAPVEGVATVTVSFKGTGKLSRLQ